MAMIRRPASVVVVRPLSSSVRRRPPFSKIFSETAWPIKAKFYMKHLWEGETNVFINNPGHMTKMAAMPICNIMMHAILKVCWGMYPGS